MAVRQDSVQLNVQFITDESKALARTNVDTKKYNDEIRAAQKNIADYKKELDKAGTSEAKRSELLAKMAVEEKKVAAGFDQIAAAGKKTAAIDLSKVAPAQLVARARQLAVEMHNIPQSAPRFKALQDELLRVNNQLKAINQSTKGGNTPAGGGIFGTITNLATNGARAIPILGTVVAGFQALRGAFSGADKLEQLTISFETFLGSAEKAKSVIKDLRQFADVTPFETEQVNSAGRALLAFGFTTKELIPTLTRIGDIASGTGKDFNELALIYGKAKTQGLIQGEELNQLAEAGIPIYGELAKVLGVNESQIRKLGEQGKIQFSDLEKVFQNLTGEGGKFGGLMERQSQSLGGLYSTLKSSLSNLLTQVGTTLAPLAKSGMQLLIGAVEVLGKVAAPVFQAFSTFFTGAIEGAQSVVSAFRNQLPGAIRDFVTAAEQLPIVGKGITFLLTPIRLVIDAFESLSATARGVWAGLADVFATGGQNVGKAYGEARNKALQEERQQAARDRAEDARDERQLTAQEKAELAAVEKKAAAAAEEQRNKARIEAQKRADAAFEAALKAVEVNIKRQELFAENARFKGEISEDAYQQRLSDITEQGLNARLDVYRRFYRAQSADALEVQNRLAAGAREAALKQSDFTALPGRAPGSITSQRDTQTGQDLALAALADRNRQKVLADRFQALLLTESDYELKRLELKRQALDEEIAILRASTTDQSAEVRKKEEERYRIEEEIGKKRVENEQRTEALRRKAQEEGFAATAELFGLAADLLQQDEKARKKNASAIKAFQTAQVITSGILEVQKIWAGVTEFGPIAGPIIGGLLTGVAVARTALAINKIEKAKFAGGGFTGSGYGAPDETGHRPAGIVHAGEYVAPKSQVNHPVTGPVIRWLENRRLKGYAAGGFVTVNTTPNASVGQSVAAPPSFGELNKLNDIIGMLSVAVANFPRESRARVVLTDLEEQQDTLNTVRLAASI